MAKKMISLGTLFLLLTMSRRVAYSADGSCVDCHRTTHANAALTHNFTEWQSSIHAQSGAECQACHGGDATQTTKAGAHAGMLASTNPKSPVYYTEIPATCGKCHEPELAAFRKSAHFKELQRSGRGPNCVTCHGAMANRVITPENMRATCSLCHHQPVQSYQARTAIEEAQVALRRLNGEIQSALTSKLVDPAKEQKTYQLLADRLHQAKVDWHAFQVEKVLLQAKDIAQKAEMTFTELKSKNQKP